ncbi:adenine nucleotide alpha hydrolase family protein [Caballeronia cordobensis]|uniref:hypothetical protein n=1 Tax=Caballeronia cordobensis TaxID=1353886 RepID=UPI001F41D6EF|nr:hypothetical protein [Caballeronia cordobensis]
MEQEILSKMEAAIGVMQRYVELGHSLSCAYSGGKDSTCALVLMVEAIRRAGGTTITHHVQSADTTIENCKLLALSVGRAAAVCRSVGVARTGSCDDAFVGKPVRSVDDWTWHVGTHT